MKYLIASEANEANYHKKEYETRHKTVQKVFQQGLYKRLNF